MRPMSGEIIFNGEVLTRLSSQDIVNRGILHVPEGRRLFSDMTVEENLLMGAYRRGKDPGLQKDLDRMYGIFERLKERRKQKAGSLSGGEQQRAAIARALINSPDLILADEPTGNLDSLTGTQILDIFKQLHSRNEGRTIIMITHDMSVADYADRRIVLKDGRMNDDL